MPDLPVRDLTSAHLAELVAAPGCPGCREEALVVERFTEAYLYESVNDVRFRAELDTARGMCGEHVGAMLQADRRRSGGMLGSAILLDAMLRVREAELRSALGARGPLRARRIRDAARTPACPVCRATSSSVEGALRHLVRLTREPGWAAAVMHTEPCQQHLLVMLATPDRPPAWDAIERGQLERLGRLRARLIAHADHAAHDRRHLATADERRAVDEAGGYLGGAERVSSDARGRRAASPARSSHAEGDLEVEL